jgi:hypothetical protein
MRQNIQIAPYARLTLDGGDLLLDSSYDPGIVQAFKALVPPSDRAWDKGRRVWRVAPKHGRAVADLFKRAWGLDVAVPSAKSSAPAAPQMKVFKLEYLGQCKERDDGSVSAMGYADGAWSVIAPEAVLRGWFEGHTLGASEPAKGVGRETLYGLLGVPQDADAAAVKAGYRRMARQWHPDTCSEPNAQEMFVLIKGAYDVLSDPLKRKKYDAGLFFAANEQQKHMPDRFSAFVAAYRAPLRCGMVVAEAAPSLGRWTLQRIIGWNDITDLSGRVMVASWDRDNDRIKVEWVQP